MKAECIKTIISSYCWTIIPQPNNGLSRNMWSMRQLSLITSYSSCSTPHHQAQATRLHREANFGNRLSSRACTPAKPPPTRGQTRCNYPSPVVSLILNSAGRISRHASVANSIDMITPSNIIYGVGGADPKDKKDKKGRVWGKKDVSSHIGFP